MVLSTGGVFLIMAAVLAVATLITAAFVVIRGDAISSPTINVAYDDDLSEDSTPAVADTVTKRPTLLFQEQQPKESTEREKGALTGIRMQQKSSGNRTRLGSLPKGKFAPIYKRPMMPSRTVHKSGIGNDYVDDLLGRHCKHTFSVAAAHRKKAKEDEDAKEAAGEETDVVNITVDLDSDKQIGGIVAGLIALVLGPFAYLLYKMLTKAPELKWYERNGNWPWILCGLAATVVLFRYSDWIKRCLGFSTAKHTEESVVAKKVKEAANKALKEAREAEKQETSEEEKELHQVKFYPYPTKNNKGGSLKLDDT